MNIYDLDSDDEPIGKILAPGIAKRLKNRKGKAVESSNTPSKSLRRRTSVGSKRMEQGSYSCFQEEIS